MTLVQGQKRPVQKGQASEAPTDRSNNRDHKNPLELNEPRLFKALEAPTRPPKALFPAPSAPDIAQYTQKDMNYLL